ncbi:uncharacterized protein LOC126775381 [Nymphalis io]|uniref:uncharacterized protein LOC126775381 n=1 Tax=Inachis io TaxID=171585 RepID=UPI00216A0319|nr:uncharacterized protein LOC126775381 [Nymphalis io]
MDFKAEQFVDDLLSDEAHKRPSDDVNVEDLEMKLPEWFDEKKFKQGRRFYLDFSVMFTASMLLGLVAVLAVPSILNVLIGTRRSNSVYTSYKRYLSTYFHTMSWFRNELKPGSESWRSLYTVRSRHLQASRASKLKGNGIISQRDMALTLFGFIGFSFLKPEKFAITQLQKGDWEAYNFTWRTIGYMIGLEDRYNICRESFDETRQICKVILKRVFTPCLENVPEYFEHMAKVMTQGTGTALSAIEPASMVYAAKYMAEVPGYVYTEDDRMNLQETIKKHLKGRSTDIGIDAAELLETCTIDGLPKRTPNLLYYHDYDSVETSPAYKTLPLTAKYILAFNSIVVTLYSTYVGRIFFNFYLEFVIFVSRYFPYVAMWKFGIKNALINMFKEGPVDDAIPQPNSEYNKPKPRESWYKVLFDFIW